MFGRIKRFGFEIDWDQASNAVISLIFGFQNFVKNDILGPYKFMKTTIGIIIIGWIACCELLAGDQSGASASLFQASRAGDRSAVRALLKNGADLHARDEFGNTPLMTAALCADAALLEILLKAGADVNATNKEGATALMRAATFGDKARLLVAHHSDVKARSVLGNSALILAARQQGNMSTVKLLLDQGAEVNATNANGATALMAAVSAEDAEMAKFLIERGADVNAKPNMDGNGFLWGGGRTPLMWAAFRGNEGLVRLLLAHGAKVNDFTLSGSALTMAGWAGHAGVAKILLDAGAQVDQRDIIANYTPLHWAASSERSNPNLVELLLAHHADANAEGGQPVDNFLGVLQTPLMLARKRGETPLVQSLLKAGAQEVPLQVRERTPKYARQLANAADGAVLAEAVQLGVRCLQTTGIESQATFLRHASKQDCISCHQQQLPLTAISLARKYHIDIDETAVQKLTAGVTRFGDQLSELDLQTVFHPEPAIGNGYNLIALQLERRPSSASTDSQVHQLAVIQNAEGYWPWNLPRPPIQSSAIGATALAVKGIRAYAIPGRQREFDQRIQRARAWLAKTRAESNEERAYQLLGLAWAGESSGKLAQLSKELVGEQRPDGGWGQLAKLPSDAYATGHSIYALIQGGALSASHPAVRRGIDFLLRTQLADGTWHVKRRAHPFQPPMESSFPHGADGWISSAATSWAVMALTSAMDPSQPRKSPTVLANTRSSAPVAAMKVEDVNAKPVDFERDIQPLLSRSCVDCHSGERARGGFRAVDRASLLQGGKRGEPVVVPGKPEQSPLLRFAQDQVEDLEMPPLNKRTKYPALTKEEVGMLTAWVAQGAK